MKPALTPADRRRRDLRRLRAGIVTLVAVALYAALLWPIRMSVTDDTYIHLVYAKHFRDGLALVFNVGQPVFGTTSPLWSLGLGWLGRTGVDLLTLARGLSMLFGALAILAFAVFLRCFLESWVSEQGFGAGRSEVAWALGTLAFAADVWLVRWSATGMETALATFLVIAGLASYVSRRPWGNRVLVPAMWWSLAALARPEAAVLLGLLVLRVAVSGSPARVKFERLGWVLLPIALVHGAWLAYALPLYGTALPVTLAAKTAGGAGAQVFFDLLLRQAKAIAAARGVELVTLVALAPALASRFWVRRADHFVPLAWMIGLPLLYAARGVPAISRYLVPILPLLVAYAWGTLAWLAAGARRRPALAVAGLLLIGALSLANSLYTYARFVVPQADAFSQDVDGALGSLGRWCREHTPPGTEIAIPDIGAFAYFADRPVVDLAGLVTPAITLLLQRYPYDDLVTHLRFEGVARPPYLIDRADMPRRMLFESPYAPCLTPILVGRVDQRGIQHPEPAYYTLYRVDWVEFDHLAGGERRASAPAPGAIGASGPLRSAQTGPPELATRKGPEAPPTPWAGGEDRVPRIPAAGQSTTPANPSDAATASVGRRRTFRVCWGAPDGRGSLLDTGAEIFVYDRIGDPDTTIAMPWSASQIDTMWQAAVALRIFELPVPCPGLRPAEDRWGTRCEPSFDHVLELQIDLTQKRFEWLDCPDDRSDQRDLAEWDRLREFTRLLDAMVVRHPAWRAMPPPRGVYL